ncbi:hypothetical protein GCM10027569_86610 [Flindersiella endophytica]
MRDAQRACDRERGAVSAFVAVAVLAMLFAAGLAVDGGTRARTAAKANALAAEAGRAAAQQVVASEAVRGEAVTLDRNEAVRAAHAYLDRAGALGHVNVSSTQVVVETSLQWHPILLSMLGVEPEPMHGRATVEVVHR